MKRTVTSRDIQRTDFVKNLYEKLHKETKKPVTDYKQFVQKAASYIADGLSREESIELLVLDGLKREAAKNYIDMVEDQATSILDEEESNYSFTFENSQGMVLSSYDIGRFVTASSDTEAMDKAYELLDNEDFEVENIFSVEKVE